ncbi:MAG: glycosyltransferase family 4 protein [Candidatus Bathyarchaeia archaeon]
MCPRYYPHFGGVEENVRRISETLACKHDVTVLTTDPAGNLPKVEYINDVRVLRFKGWAPNEACSFSRGLRNYIMERSGCFDVVHAHSYHAFPALYTALAKAKKRMVFSPHYHGTGHTFIRKMFHIPYRVLLGKKIFMKADKVICVSNFEESLVLKHFKVERAKVIVIPNGLNFEEFRSLEKNRESNPSHRKILYVGRLEKYKGVQYLVKALAKLDNDIILEVVGKGPYKKSLVRLAKRLRVDSRIRFFQDLPRHRLLHKYAEADLFALLSRYEAYGISLAEALASRTPCIVANTSALREFVDNKNCFGVDYPVDIDMLAELTLKIIGKDVNGLKFPSWMEVAEKTFEVYSSC